MNANQHLICNDTLREQIRLNLDRFQPDSHDRKDTTHAAVALTIVDVFHGPGIDGHGIKAEWDKTAALILTRRASTLKTHSGQWALPGGRMEPGERAQDTALRELSEEVGLALGPDRVLGRLDDFTTHSGFTITPVVIWGGPGVRLSANASEVSSMHRIPISEFLRDDAPILKNGAPSKQPILLMPVGDRWIAAPTGALLYQFREVAVLGHPTRVAHYEQPLFAWQ